MQENEYDSTKRSYTVHRLRRSVRALIGPKKEDTTLKREKNGSYYGHVWLDRELYQGLSFFARVNHVTLKEATRQALRAGLSRLLGDGIRESTRREAALREQGLPAKPTPLTREIKRRAKARGFHLGEDL